MTKPTILRKPAARRRCGAATAEENFPLRKVETPFRSTAVSAFAELRTISVDGGPHPQGFISGLGSRPATSPRSEETRSWLEVLCSVEVICSILMVLNQLYVSFDIESC